jgi:hypothetical protein
MDPLAMGITLMRNSLIIGRILTPHIRVTRIVKLALGGLRGIGLLARAAPVFASAADAFPH